MSLIEEKKNNTIEKKTRIIILLDQMVMELFDEILI
jgi:hypothetical protein